MKELELKYGCNPNQKPSRIYMEQGELPLTVLNGKPGYINFLDALNGWQLVSELKRAKSGFSGSDSVIWISGCARRRIEATRSRAAEKFTGTSSRFRFFA